MQFRIAPLIYHFLICYMSFSKPKNFRSLRLRRDRRYPQFSGFMYGNS